MSANHSHAHDYSAPSVQERIIALHQHNQLFETIAEYPQAGICGRFGKEWALVTADIEGKVHRYGRAVEVFIRENARPGGEVKGDDTLEGEFDTIMGLLMDTLFLHHRAFKASREMAVSSPPSKLAMKKYRANGGTGEGCGLTTLHNEDLEPIDQFIVDWLMDPFADYIGGPLRSLWFWLPMCRKRSRTDIDLGGVNGGTTSAVARAFVGAMAILLLAAPIATLNTIEQPKLRIVVMALFGQVFALSAQFVGPRSLPLYSLITSYFQTMVVFVGTTSVQKIRQ